MIDVNLGLFAVVIICIALDNVEWLTMSTPIDKTTVLWAQKAWLEWGPTMKQNLFL